MMIVFPNCKINLGLRILRKRDDGFHDIETIFYPVKLMDALEIIPQKDDNAPVEFTSTGLNIEGEEEDNLCRKAYHLLKKDLPQLPSVKMHLHKVIPMGAGLGGGSADGAFALQLLNDKFGLGISTDRLLPYALELGSDGPFFIINSPCLATGRGEVLEKITADLSAYKIILVNPGIHINTTWAFAQVSAGYKPSDAYPRSLKEIVQQPISTWKDEMKNDFESPVFEKYPEIKSIKEELYNHGALYAAMSGSGSTVFGIFDESHMPPRFSGTNYFVSSL